MRRPERAAANSEGRCKRAAAGYVARDITERRSEGEVGVTVPSQLAVLDGQTLAAFGAASVDDSAATTSFHPNTKTVRALASGDGGLVGTFHD